MKKVLCMMMLLLGSLLVMGLNRGGVAEAADRLPEDELRVLMMNAVPDAPGRFVMEVGTNYEVGTEPRIKILLVPINGGRGLLATMLEEQIVEESCDGHSCDASVSVLFDVNGLPAGEYSVNVVLENANGEILVQTVVTSGYGGHVCSAGICLPQIVRD
ncbi:MAG TPA: hypothetical protein VLL52_23055 [Anaerolineae bacterium]|nr:hypothetical protein [Anaerolineae bacterium]